MSDIDQRQEERERFQELLQELRVMIPGVEVLFAFLLTSVFSSRFGDLDATGRGLFAVALVSSAITIVLFLAPAALHRLGDDDRATRTRIAVGFSLVGSVFLGIAMTTAMFVVVRFIYDSTMAALLAGLVAFALVALWYVFPLLRRATNGSETRS